MLDNKVWKAIMNLKFSQTTRKLVPLTEEVVSTQKIKPGDTVVSRIDLVHPSKHILLYKAGKPYEVLGYYLYETGGLQVRTENNKRGFIFFGENGGANYFDYYIDAQDESNEEAIFDKYQPYAWEILKLLYDHKDTPVTVKEFRNTLYYFIVKVEPEENVKRIYNFALTALNSLIANAYAVRIGKNSIGISKKGAEFFTGKKFE